MKRVAAAAIALCALAAPAFAQKATVKVINQSKWEIHHLFLSSSAEEDWGPDQLEDEILTKGDQITLTGIPCDEYDIKVVDEDGDECIIEAVELCKDHSFWKITDKDLLECEGYD
ncbi:MAG TPA: hypothetical protein VF432_32280 [Thermoanaerobaculia bacterium]